VSRGARGLEINSAQSPRSEREWGLGCISVCRGRRAERQARRSPPIRPERAARQRSVTGVLVLRPPGRQSASWLGRGLRGGAESRDRTAPRSALAEKPVLAVRGRSEHAWKRGQSPFPRVRITGKRGLSPFPFSTATDGCSPSLLSPRAARLPSWETSPQRIPLAAARRCTVASVLAT
jgi:hypothetical protein